MFSGAEMNSKFTLMNQGILQIETVIPSPQQVPLKHRDCWWGGLPAHIRKPKKEVFVLPQHDVASFLDKLLSCCCNFINVDPSCDPIPNAKVMRCSEEINTILKGRAGNFPALSHCGSLQLFLESSPFTCRTHLEIPLEDFFLQSLSRDLAVKHKFLHLPSWK